MKKRIFSKYILPFFVAGLFLLLIFVFPFFIKTDSDFWWHLQTGATIIACHCVPLSDPFSSTVAHARWIVHEWLIEVIVVLIAKYISYFSVVLLFSILTIFSIFFVACTSYIRTKSISLSLVSIFLVGFLYFGAIGVRMQVITLFMFSLLLLLLEIYQNVSAKVLYVIPFIFLIWANMHAGWVIGIMYLFLCFICIFLKKRHFCDLSQEIIICFLSLFAVCLNPNGFSMLIYPFTYFTNSVPVRFINEWQAIDFHNPYFLMIGILMLAEIFLFLQATGKKSFQDFLFFFLFLYFGLTVIRNIPLFGIVSAPIIVSSIAVSSFSNKKIIYVLSSWIFWVFLFVGSLYGALLTGRILFLNAAYTASERGYPVSAVSYLQEHHSYGNLYNDYGWGGFLIEKLYPRMRVFIDGRTDIYGPVFTDYFAIQNAYDNTDSLLQKRHVTYVLISPNSSLAAFLLLDSQWKEIYHDKEAVIFHHT